MQKFWPENIDAIYKSHRTLLVALIDQKKFNDMYNLGAQLEIIFKELIDEISESELSRALTSLNKKVKKLKEAASYKNRIIAILALNALDDLYFEEAK